MQSRRRATAAAIGLGLLAGACGGGGQSGGGLSGSVSVDGSSTVGPISEAIAEEFASERPGVNVTVGISGTGGGFEKFCAGEIDVVDASRPAKDEEIATCRSGGLELVGLQVALDGLAVVANKSVTWTDCLTFDQLRAIWDQGSTVKTWEDVDASYPEEPLPLFGPGTDSGTFDFFTGTINGEEGRSRTDYTSSEDDNVLVRGVEGEGGALGYFGIGYFEQNRDRLEDLAVDKGDGNCVTPSAETVRSSEYPLSRPLFVYVSRTALARPEVEEFLRFYLDTVNDIVADVGYVALPATLLEKSHTALAAALKGR